ncbi:monomeric [FeFe] hydrogenase [Carboxylicivirga sp. M1479]|uniref:monomeric [FeFe] hydrogenase n=1 Tax=Carboxylicivirga sp. M1479 TaxID=2594476 RepID=UPI00117811CA|nr:monomeric [FeFe] hydrogenase [Carboxylicivirga sp. M1479]TRX71116.1 4Fe-4S dicluster domain-containing protein [Carboxylicivirga sp. M1479]
MTYYNNAVITKRELLVRLIQQLDNDTLLEKIDRIPLEMRPRTNSPIRCCVHKDRAVIKYKIMALLGFNIADETDELAPLRDYAEQALKGYTQNGNFLTVVDEACSSCVQVNYTVSNLCQGCEGRPCQVNCPKDAIMVINGKANIDHQKCVNCGICQKACPFHAIAYLPVPCEESCPVKAIRKNADGIEEIDFDKCIHCGKCMTACPFGAISEKSQVLNLYYNIKHQSEKTVAMVAPAILSQFKASSSQILNSIKAIGFDEVIEVAEGANMTTDHETQELLERLDKGASFMTTSCCPSYIQFTEKHAPELKPFVSDTPSPMAYTAQLAKDRFPNYKAVFIGPCLAKRSEAYTNENIDYVITTEELGAMFAALKIDLVKTDITQDLDPVVRPESRAYAAVGGVTNAIKTVLSNDHQLKTELIDGIDKKSIRLLKTLAKKNVSEAAFYEVMACDGGCINGPVNVAPLKVSQNKLKKAIQEIQPEEAVI